MLVRHVTGGPLMYATPHGDGYLCRWIDGTGGPCELDCDRSELLIVHFEAIPPKPTGKPTAKVVALRGGGG